MKKTIFLSVLAYIVVSCAHASTPFVKGSDQELSSSLGITILDEPEKTSSGLKKDTPRILRYFNGGARMPSCGFITKKASKYIITPILNVDAGEDFPNCASLDKAATFKSRDETIIVIQYSTQETRNEIDQQYYFARSTTDGDLQPIKSLNDATQPQSKSIGQIASWAQMQLDKQKNINQSVFLEKDSVTTSNGYYGIRESKAEHVCTFTASPAIGEESSIIANKTCTRFLASTVLTTTKNEYFIGLYEDINSKPTPIIFSASNGKVKSEPEIEEKLKSASASGKILAIKNALKKFTADQK